MTVIEPGPGMGFRPSIRRSHAALLKKSSVDQRS
ncbi:hypothetical protein Ga0466249_001185 [Sporomusaceae bacterium BoRhaA]|nr:hypothetical protein [Pelorhabdus rhamnosifermentans]